ncbi:hypothetical protein V8C42DRAFT_341218 [Trichoderma barbatum]
MQVHHTLGDGKFDMFHEMSKFISCATTVLSDEKTATDEIDRVLQAMLFFARPAYIGIPMDMVHLTVLVRGSITPLPALPEPNNENEELELIDLITSKIQSSTHLH